MWRLRPTWPPPSPERMQQLRGPEGAAGDDRRPPGAHGVRRGGRRSSALPARHWTPTARPSSTSSRRRLDAGAEPRPGRDRARQVADVHAALGVDPAAVGAGAALDAVAGVAGDRPAAGAERLGALHRELAVAAHPLGVERASPAGTPRPRRSRGRGRAPSSTPCSLAPVLEHLVRGAEAGARVDHRRAADHLRHRDRDRRVALGDRQAARRGRASRSPRAGRPGSCRGCSGRRPRARSRRGRPRRASAAAAAPPAPEPTITTSHSSPSPAGVECRRAEPAGSGRLPSARRQLVSIPIRSSTSGSTA